MGYIWRTTLAPTGCMSENSLLVKYIYAPRRKFRNLDDKIANDTLAAPLDSGCLWPKEGMILNHTPCWGKHLLCWVLRLQVCSYYLVSWLISRMAERDPGLQPKSDTSLHMHGLHLKGKSLPQQGVWFNIFPSYLCKHPEAGSETRRTSLQTEFLGCSAWSRMLAT